MPASRNIDWNDFPPPCFLTEVSVPAAELVSGVSAAKCKSREVTPERRQLLGAEAGFECPARLVLPAGAGGCLLRGRPGFGTQRSPASSSPNWLNCFCTDVTWSGFSPPSLLPHHAATAACTAVLRWSAGKAVYQYCIKTNSQFNGLCEKLRPVIN